MQGKVLCGAERCDGILCTALFPYSGDVNLKAEGVREAAGQCAALQMGRERDF